MSLWDFFKQRSVEVPRQKQQQDMSPEEYLLATDAEYRKVRQKIKRQDQQLEAIKKAEAEYKESGDLDTYIKFWENLLTTDGILFNGVGWPFRIVELYYKAKRYDDAWRELNKLVLDPYMTKKARKWQ